MTELQPQKQTLTLNFLTGEKVKKELRRMRLRYKTVKEVTVTFEDGSIETWTPEEGAAYYRERLTYQEDSNHKVTAVLDCHEAFWVIKREVIPDGNPRQGEASQR